MGGGCDGENGRFPHHTSPSTPRNWEKSGVAITAVFHPNFAQTTLTAPRGRVILPAVVCRSRCVSQANCVTK